MTYPETLDYLFNSLPMYHKIGERALKPTLNNTLALCSFLDNPHKKLKTIHIAGTNGKGSTSHMLAAVLQTAGYKTALFTSPHLKNFTERIRINGKEMSAERVVEFVENNKVHFENIKPSFFEMTVAMAFDYFVKEEVDIAVVEVGLGGRFDSTNIITPEFSIITNISFDHQNILGDTLSKIAYEKAGIIKPEVPVVISEYQQEVIDVFISKAKETRSQIIPAYEKYILINERNDNRRLLADVLQDKQMKYKDLAFDLLGKYQMKNIPGILAGIDILKRKGFNIPDETLRKAFADVTGITGLKGRWQILSNNPLTICDTGHNEAGIRFVVEQINSLTYNKLHFVFGAVNDKDIDKILTLLPVDAYYYFCQPDIPRGLNVDVLSSKAQSFGLKGEVVQRVNKAIAKAKENAGENDLIFIGGSNFVVAEIEEL